jgi:PAS domain S-box-containing protein
MFGFSMTGESSRKAAWNAKKASVFLPSEAEGEVTWIRCDATRAVRPYGCTCNRTRREPFMDIRRKNLDALLGIAATGMFSVDSEMRVRSMNREAEHLLGVDAREAVGLTCEELMGPHVCSPDCALKLTFADREPRRDWAVRIDRADGAQRDVILSTALLDAPAANQRELVVALRDVTEAERLRKAMSDRWVFHGLVCASGKMKEIVSLVREMGPYDSTVLLLGESGTGKEVVARAVHVESTRRDRPFLPVNCSAYSEGVLESELFGHVRGAFTGATRERKGRFETASGGTVFLDEVAEISPAIQVKLLRVLQERIVERVGDQKPIPVDIRVVAATNRDLKRAVSEGRFREDLYYRLNVIAVHLPPLRDRRRHSSRLGKEMRAISVEAMDMLFRYDWPGNVREIENAIEHAVVRAHGSVIVPRDFPPEVRGADPHRTHGADHRSSVQAALQAAGGRIGRAAEILGVHRTTLWRWLRKAERRQE